MILRVKLAAGIAALVGLSLAAGCGGSSSGSTSPAAGGSANPATHLAFVQQPVTATSGVAISPSVTVALLTAAGGVATGTANPVTLALATNPGGLGVLAGTTTVNASNGLATFPGIHIDAMAMGYTLRATSSGLVTATSTTFDVAPELAQTTTLTGIPTFIQYIPLADPDRHQPFPGAAGYWDLDRNFGILDGFNDQWDGMQLSVQTAVGSVNYPRTVTLGAVTFSTPIFTAADGIVVAAVTGTAFDGNTPLGGTRTAYLNALSEARLQQTVNLATSSGTLVLSWTDNVNGTSSPFPDVNDYYQVVFRDGSGNVLATATANPFTIPGTVTGTVVLSFEQRQTGSDEATPAWTAIDDVSIKDGNGTGTEFVTNGDFENGTLSGWTTSSPRESQNLTAAPKDLGNGVQVTRSFYATPTSLWGRYTDEFVNLSTTAAVSVTLTYDYNEGSDGRGVEYFPTGAGQKAVVSWDSSIISNSPPGRARDRDIGLVFGSATSVTFNAATALNTPSTGSHFGHIVGQYNLNIPVGGRVTVVQFQLMSGIDTGGLASTVDLTARATELDSEALTIIQDIRTDPQYLRGLTLQQFETLFNF